MQDLKLWSFPGGLKLTPHKDRAAAKPIQVLPLSTRYTVPLRQHAGEPAAAVAPVGARVLKGQLIACAQGARSVPVHAPTSGIVRAITSQPIPHPAGLAVPCVIIEADGEDQWGERQPMADYTAYDPARLRARINEAGIVGLGGAAFPTAVKLKPHIEWLILNGAECEPYIACDDRLMRERPQEVLEGLRILRHIVNARHTIIALEDSYLEAHRALNQALGNAADDIQIVQVPTRYPAGGERQLIRTLTGREVASHQVPTDVGILCHNVGTAVAVYRAIVHGEPLISRIVTVTGNGVAAPHNVEARIGTPLTELIVACGGYTGEVNRLIMGGPMMGFALPSDELPVIKATNCLLAATAEELPPPPPALPCIRCGDCARVCPARLLPQELYRFIAVQDFARARDDDLFGCIECGLCAYVCPSFIPLVDYYRFAKDEIRYQDKAREAAAAARTRFEQRTIRLEREQAEAAARQAAQQARLTGPKAKAEIQAALARAKTRRKDSSIPRP